MKKCISNILFIVVLCMGYSFSLFAKVDFQVKIPENIKAGETFFVEIDIFKTGVNGFSKFETKFPYSFQIEGVDCEEATFIYKDNKAKFIWMDLPRKDKITVSYKVTVPESFEGVVKLENLFYYIFDKEKKSVKKEMEMLVNNDNPEVVIKDPVVALYKDKESIRKRILFDLRFEIKQPVVYRVQLAAFSNKNVPQEFLDELCEKEFKLKSQESDGLVKYYVGNFYSFETAEMFRKYCGVKDAFIIAFNKGKRISIEEAKNIQKGD